MIKAVDRFQERSIVTSLFFPRSRLFIAGNRKAAGTSLRWWLLPLHGVDVEALTKDVVGRELVSTEAVWAGLRSFRYIWKALSDQERQDALESADVLRIAPIRHPVPKVFSAWSQKYLQLEPGFPENLPEGFPAPAARIDSREQIRDEFTAFARALGRTDRSWKGIDGHLYPQHLVLGAFLPDLATFVRTEEMANGVELIQKHLAQHGVEAGPMPRFNEAVVPYQDDLVSGEALDVITAMYAKDFTTFDYEPSTPVSKHKDVSLDWLNDVRDRNRHWGLARDELTRLRKRSGGGRNRPAPSSADAEVRRLRRRVDELERENAAIRGSTSWKVTAPLRSLRAGRGR
jgi:hypothetical protein